MPKFKGGRESLSLSKRMGTRLKLSTDTWAVLGPRLWVPHLGVGTQGRALPSTEPWGKGAVGNSCSQPTAAHFARRLGSHFCCWLPLFVNISLGHVSEDTLLGGRGFSPLHFQSAGVDVEHM